MLFSCTCILSFAQKSFYMIDKNDFPGTNVSIPVGVTGFDDIISFQGSIVFDPSVLSYSSISGFNLPGFSISSFGLTQTGLGIITYSWYDASLQGESLLDSSSLFTLDFDVIGSSGQNCFVYFSSNPTDQEVSDTSLSPISFSYDDMVFYVNNLLSFSEIDCDFKPFPNIIKRNFFVNLNGCFNKEKMIIYSVNGTLNKDEFLFFENKLYFFSNGIYFLKSNNVITKIIVI